MTPQEKYRMNNLEKVRERDRAFRKKYYAQHKEEVCKKQTEWRLKNIESVRSKDRKRNKIRQPERNRRNRELRAKAPDLVREKERILRIRRKETGHYARRLAKDLLRRRTDLNFRLKQNLRSRMGMAVRLNSGLKAAKTMILIGCTVEFLRGHLEAKFKPGMSWENYGEWHIDHIIPCAEFDLRDAKQQAQCFHYSNLQPLWGVENCSKGHKQKTT